VHPLTQPDIDAAFDAAVPPGFLERLDTRLGTVDVVRLLKSRGQVWHVGSHCDDGPFPEWCRRIDRTPRGFEVSVRHGDEVVRAGVLPWNRLANMATLRALAQWPREPVAGEQLAML
jgi:hypothetical protein